MDFSKEAVDVATFLLPGFVTLKVLDLQIVHEDTGYEHYVINALILSLVMYAIASPFKPLVGTSAYIALMFVLATTLGLALGWVITNDFAAKVLERLYGTSWRLSMHDRIYPIKGIQRFTGKWHVIKLTDGSEICGIIREFNSRTKEMLVEKGQLVLGNGGLAPDAAWYYVPSGEQIVFMRTIEE